MIKTYAQCAINKTNGGTGNCATIIFHKRRNNNEIR